MDELAVGATFADHVIRGVAGRGGMGVVYRALHVPLKREVALKVISPEISDDAELRARFRREFEAAALVQHPNVIPIYHAGEVDGRLYVTMRYVEGVDLARLIAIESRLEPARAATLVAQVAAALDAAHKAGLVHRDVKPANVLVEGERAWLTDFGLTKFVRSDSTQTAAGTLIGTFDYTAPEQLNELPVDARTDVYSLGCLLYQALTGSVPFERDSLAAKLFAHLDAPPPKVTDAVPDAPAALDEIVATAMAKEPDDRYPSAGALASALLDAVGHAAPVVLAASPPVERRPKRGIALPAPITAELEGGAFVGRADQLERLRARFARVAAGERQVVVVAGEPGIGKTRLAAEAAREANANGATVLFGRSDLESLVPYQPFVTAVQHYIAQRETLALPAELEPELAELARFVPALRLHLPSAAEPLGEDGDTRRYRLFEAVTRVLAFIAREAPTILILDDLQWADSSTVLLLAHLLRDPEAARLLVIATLRDADGARAPELDGLLAQLHRGANFEKLTLAGLDRAETQELASTQDHANLSESFIGRLRAGTDGNPFYIKEMLRSLAESGGELDRLPVPEGVKQLIGTRLARLSQESNRILQAAAVIGRDFDVDVLRTLLDEPEDRVLIALEEAVAAGLVVEDEVDADRFAFAHALVRETLYEALSASRRVRTHHAVAVALERVGRAGAAEIAHHYLESRHLDRDGRATELSVRAGEEASASLAYQEAAAHYRRALERLADGDERECELLIALGGAESRAGDPAAAATFTRAAALALTQGAAEPLAHAALGLTSGYAQAGAIDREGVVLLEGALTKLGDADDALAAQLLARLANVLHFAGQEERVEELSTRALELAHATGDPAALLAALEARLTALVSSPDLDQRLALARELLALADRLGERELKAMALHWHTYNLLEAGQVDRAREQSRALSALAAELRQPKYQHFAVRWEAMWAQLADRDDETQALIMQAHEVGTRAQAPEVDIEAAGRQLALAYRHGTLGQFAEVLEAQARDNPQLGTNYPVLALAYLQAGRREDAAALLDRLARDGFGAIPRDMLWLGGICLLSHVAAGLGDAERAAVLYRLLEPHRHRNVMIGMAACFGSVERYLGLLAAARSDWEAAEEHFERALERNAAGGFDNYFAVVRSEYAAMLEARGEALRAAQLRAEELADGPFAQTRPRA